MDLYMCGTDTHRLRPEEAERDLIHVRRCGTDGVAASSRKHAVCGA